MKKDNFQIDLVAGARPNFMKLAPVVSAINRFPQIKIRIVHTGQHYDNGMNEVFFKELEIPEPAINLGVGSGTHGFQTARILERYESLLMETPKPQMVIVFGDVNSTVACALAAVKLLIPVAHVEAGLRSFDRTMPEEINRVLTDAISTIHFVSEPSGIENLKREGITGENVRFVGNVMIDTLTKNLEKAKKLKMPDKLGLIPQNYGYITIHRPSNVDDTSTLIRLLETLQSISKQIKLVFPMHPRTKLAIERIQFKFPSESEKSIITLPPLPYIESLGLISSAKFVMTDSGGIQEETTFLGIPCITLRKNTERPVTVELGTNKLVGNDPEKINKAVNDIINGNWKTAQSIPLWDGKASERIAEYIFEWLKNQKN